MSKGVTLMHGIDKSDGNKKESDQGEGLQMRDMWYIYMERIKTSFRNAPQGQEQEKQQGNQSNIGLFKLSQAISLQTNKGVIYISGWAIKTIRKGNEIRSIFKRAPRNNNPTVRFLYNLGDFLIFQISKVSTLLTRCVHYLSLDFSEYAFEAIMGPVGNKNDGILHTHVTHQWKVDGIDIFILWHFTLTFYNGKARRFQEVFSWSVDYE